MFQNKPDILLFLYISTLIFAEKIVITDTCQINAVKIVALLMLIICPIQISGTVNQINFLAMCKNATSLNIWQSGMLFLFSDTIGSEIISQRNSSLVELNLLHDL
ncbi:hypothetical protein C1645_785587 [Glomus cerebriforme]|uniref:Uncharacterized protein n=1 Tax=Glomus cerebriforme TaxID=658196 RepID=A0A397SDY8_9GLOM|nr:hypothetical protein C1645_785587 [Glomus cerebriforme]